MSRRTRLMAVTGGVVCLSASAWGLLVRPGAARADSTAGSGLSSYALNAQASGIEWTYDSPSAPTHPELDDEVPFSQAQLQPGPIGYGLGAVAWPGTLIANGGSTAGLVGINLPQPLASNANEPVRAEARTGSGPSTVQNTSYPGTLMTAQATAQQVAGYASVGGTSGPAPSSGSGNTETSTKVSITGASTVTAEASSTVKNVVLAGVVKIGSVVSTAQGQGDGTNAKATGSTTVSDVTVAGVPVAIDQSGVHVLGAPGVPLNAAASELVNAALAGTGMKIAVSQPSRTVVDGALTYDAGNVVFYWSPPGSGGQTFTASLGGASIRLQAAQGSALGNVVGVAGGTGAAAPTGAAGAAGSTPLTGPDLSGSVGTTGTGGSGGPASGSGSFVPTAARPGLPTGTSVVWVIVALLGAAFLAGGLRRLPDRVLEEPTTACPLGDQP